MMDFLRMESTCPCCQGMSACADDCTFERDDPSGYERMLNARAALATATKPIWEQLAEMGDNATPEQIKAFGALAEEKRMPQRCNVQWSAGTVGRIVLMAFARWR
jgi:hypothetical protein